MYGVVAGGRHEVVLAEWNAETTGAGDQRGGNLENTHPVGREVLSP